LTMGLTHKVRCMVFLVGLGLFCDRGVPLFSSCDRVTCARGAG
jgi:hypothetical protein